MRRRALLALAALLALGACGDGASLDRLAAGEKGRVTRVVSGDSVVLDSGLTVRLAGIDAQRVGEPGAQAAVDDLARRTLGRKVRLFYGGARRDPYGRALAQLRTGDGDWVQGGLVRDGLVRVHTYPDNRAMARVLLADEARARAKGRGLWADPAWRVRLPEEVDRMTTGFQIVEGWVRRVTPTRGGTYLDFTPNRSGFAAWIPGRAADDLAAAGLPPSSLTARLVRVRGIIGWDGLMRVDHPEQIEPLRAPR